MAQKPLSVIEHRELMSELWNVLRRFGEIDLTDVNKLEDCGIRFIRLERGVEFEMQADGVNLVAMVMSGLVSSMFNEDSRFIRAFGAPGDAIGNFDRCSPGRGSTLIVAVEASLAAIIPVAAVQDLAERNLQWAQIVGS